MSTTTKRVEFDSKGLKLVGTLFLPADFDETNSYKTIVMTPPAHQIKEQTLSVYGPKFAGKGFVSLAFDYNTKGESESYDAKIRNDDNVPRKWEDLRNAISFLCTLPYVDKEKLYSLGVCAGGNIASSVLITDLRVKKLASVSALMASDFMMFTDMDAFKGMMAGANASRQKVFEGTVDYLNLFDYDDPDYVKNHPDVSGAALEGYEYYGTKRAGTETYPRFTNNVLGSLYETAAMNLGEHYAHKLIQPYIGVVGSKAETAACTKIFFDKVTSEKEYVVIEGASHVDLYDKDEYIDQAVEKIVAFFDKE